MKSTKRFLRRSWKQGRKRYIGLLFPIMAALWVTWLFTSRPDRPAHDLTSDPNTGLLLYEVPKNVTLTSLANDLADKGLISFPKAFKLFLRFSERDKGIKAGWYYVKPSNSVLEMAWLLTGGKLATHTLTIPEGKASWEIYSLLKTRFPLNKAVFDSLVHSRQFANELGLQSDGLEGYLFPDTYILPFKVSEREILQILVRRFQAVTETLRPYSPVIDRYGINGWVTLASIVEKEAAVASEQPLIAGVFYNRLLQNWSLGADPTVRFAVKKLTGPLTFRDLAVTSPYNTRRFTGLPPGPICNPGTGALRAALNPKKTEKMFFVARADGSRQHFFAVDNSEHLRYKEIAAENRRRRSQVLDSVDTLDEIDSTATAQADKTTATTLRLR